MRLLVALTVVAGLAAVLGWGPFKGLRRTRVPTVALAPLTEEAAAGDPCATTKRCVIVYVAPWCPSCREAKPMMKEIRKRLPAQDAAMKIVVGLSDRARAQAMASELGGPVFFDPDGAYHRALGASGVPTWVVVDREQKVHAQMAGWVSPLEAQMSRLGF